MVISAIHFTAGLHACFVLTNLNCLHAVFFLPKLQMDTQKDNIPAVVSSSEYITWKLGPLVQMDLLPKMLFYVEKLLFELAFFQPISVMVVAVDVRCCR